MNNLVEFKLPDRQRLCDSCVREGHASCVCEEVCAICHELYKDHVADASGPRAHPREARGEGRYELAHRRYFGVFCDECGGPCDGHDVYRFVTTEMLANPYGHGWSPYQ